MQIRESVNKHYAREGVRVQMYLVLVKFRGNFWKDKHLSA